MVLGQKWLPGDTKCPTGCGKRTIFSVNFCKISFFIRFFLLSKMATWGRASKKGWSTVSMLTEGQNHFWQKDFGQLFDICDIFY